MWADMDRRSGNYFKLKGGEIVWMSGRNFFLRDWLSTGNLLFHDSLIVLLHRKIKQVLFVNILLIPSWQTYPGPLIYTYPTLYVVTFSHFHFSNNIYFIYFSLVR